MKGCAYIHCYCHMSSQFHNIQLANFLLFHSIKLWCYCYHFPPDWEIIGTMIALKLDRFIGLNELISLAISSRSFCCIKRLNILLQGLLLSPVISVTSLDDELVNLFLIAYESRGRMTFNSILHRHCYYAWMLWYELHCKFNLSMEMKFGL